MRTCVQSKDPNAASGSFRTGTRRAAVPPIRPADVLCGPRPRRRCARWCPVAYGSTNQSLMQVHKPRSGPSGPYSVPARAKTHPADLGARDRASARANPGARDRASSPDDRVSDPNSSSELGVVETIPSPLDAATPGAGQVLSVVQEKGMSQLLLYLNRAAVSNCAGLAHART